MLICKYTVQALKLVYYKTICDLKGRPKTMFVIMTTILLKKGLINCIIISIYIMIYNPNCYMKYIICNTIYSTKLKNIISLTVHIDLIGVYDIFKPEQPNILGFYKIQTNL